MSHRTSNSSSRSSRIDLTTPCPNDMLDVTWIHGSISSKHNTDPDIQIYHYNAHTIILRQNMAVHYEAPFLFLLLGTERCMLLDTGATLSPAYFPLRSTVDTLIEEWKTVHGITTAYPLVVAHTHLHRDHYEGDAQFAGRPDTMFVPKTFAGTRDFYGFQNWPHDTNVTYDLGGGRVLHVLATPGHEDAEVTIYDAYAQIMLTGDLILPGRLYVRDWPDFCASIARLVDFCALETVQVKHLLGCHIEMSRFPQQDYYIRTTYQPHERPLPMTVAQLNEIHQAAQKITADGAQPGEYFYDAFIIYNGIPNRYFAYENMDDEAAAGDVCVECRLERECE